MIIVEFCRWRNYPRDGSGVEDVIRRLLQLNTRPTVVLLNVLRFCRGKGVRGPKGLWTPKTNTPWNRAATAFRTLCEYYRVSCVSYVDAVQPGLLAGRWKLTDVAADCLHPMSGRFGPQVLTDILSGCRRSHVPAGSSRNLPPPVIRYARNSSVGGVMVPARCYSLGSQTGKPPSISRKAVAWQTASCEMWSTSCAMSALLEQLASLETVGRVSAAIWRRLCVGGPHIRGCKTRETDGCTLQSVALECHRRSPILRGKSRLVSQV